MKNNSYYIVRLVPTLVISLFLFNILIKNTILSTRIIILPFFICSIAELIKIILLTLNKNEIAKIMNNIYIISFLLYWFGFLSYWGYISLRSKEYGNILFSLPFWLAGIYVVIKSFFKKNKKLPKRKSNYNINIIISSFLVGICFLSGIIMLFVGIKETYQLNKQTKNYITTNGYFDDYEIYKSDEDETTYQLTYCYEVNNTQYTIKTAYGTNYIPDTNSIRKIKYNPQNPNDAILMGTNNQNSLLFMGMFFTLVSFTFILITFSMLGYFDKVKIDIIGIYIGIIFCIIGIGTILFQTGTTGSLIETVKSFGLWILIPILFIIVGLFQSIKCLKK